MGPHFPTAKRNKIQWPFYTVVPSAAMGYTIFTISPSKALVSSPIRSSWPHTNLVFNIPPTAIPLKFSKFSSFPTKIPKPARTTSVGVSGGIPGRDRAIDFGKYKGKMLGSLPSTYLKWVSKNLRAGDTEEWAKLADEVLGDPVYRDRIEWELAEKILNGDKARPCSNNGNGRNAVNELVEISERFGWDNEDKGGWSKIDFGLLGTSKGGRIPRVAAHQSNVELSGSLKEEEEEDGGPGRRRERRERMRRLRNKTTSVGSGWAKQRPTMGKRQEEEEEGGGVVGSPFPGREALLRKVLNRQR